MTTTPPSPQRLSNQDLVEALVADHRAVEELFVEWESDRGTPCARRHLFDVIVAELSRHTALEERYLYPVLRCCLDCGNTMADEEIAQHAAIERTLRDLGRRGVTDPGFDADAAGLFRTVRAHIRAEERDLFPVLRTECGWARLRTLGRRLESAKELAPTRPHPLAPDTPPWNRFLGPLLGVTDRMRDEWTDRRTHKEELRGEAA